MRRNRAVRELIVEETAEGRLKKEKKREREGGEVCVFSSAAQI